jgi:hypothetical protein
MEPSQPMTPKYMTRMQVEMRGASAEPNVCTKSAEEIIWRSSLRNRYELMKVNISRAIPMLRTMTPEPILSLKLLDMFIPHANLNGGLLYIFLYVTSVFEC